MKNWPLPSKATLSDISRSLIAIHKILMDDMMEEVQRNRERVFVSGEKLNLLLNDPEFQWLRPLSSLIADIDDLVAQKEPLANLQTDNLFTTLQTLIFQSSANTLYQRLHGLFDQSPDLVVHYGRIKTILVEKRTIKKP